MWYDLVVLAILAFCTIRGAVKGVIWQLAGIVSVILCFAFAETISAAVGPHVDLPPPTNHWVVMFGAYLVISLLSFSMARSIDKWIEEHDMKEYNKHLGGLFGFGKGVVICLVLTFFIVTMSSSARESLKHSQSGKYAAIIMDRLHPVMPDNLHVALDKYIHQLDTDELDLHHRHDHDHEHGDETETELGEAQSDPPPFGEGISATPGTSIPSSSIPSGASSDNRWMPQFQNVPGMTDEFRQIAEQVLQDVPEPNRTPLANQLVGITRGISMTDLYLLQQQLAYVDGNTRQITQLIEAWSEIASGSSMITSDIWTEIYSGSSVTASPPPGGGGGTGSQTPDRRELLIEAIATIYATRPEGRSLIQQNIEQSLAGIPDQVSLAVLEDWHADLFGGADPDPGTDQLTSLEDRMYRQLQSHGIRLDQVSAEVQRRLRGVVER